MDAARITNERRASSRQVVIIRRDVINGPSSAMSAGVSCSAARTRYPSVFCSVYNCAETLKEINRATLQE